MVTASKIKQLCNQWCEAAQNDGGGFAIGHNTEQYRLLRNGVQFHELCYFQLITSVEGLTKVLLLPGLNTVVDQDHYGLWSWSAEVVLSREIGYFENEERDLRKLFETVIRSALTHCRKPTATEEEWRQQVEIENQISHNARYFIQESSTAMAYLCFPLLEGIAKKTCSNYLDLDGQVISAFSVPSRNGGTRTYDPNSSRWSDKKCSSLRDLLWLVFNTVADQQLKNSISEFREHISNLDSSEDPFDVIYRWRNESLHGTTSFQTIGGTLLNLVLLIILHQLSAEYSGKREVIIEHCRWNTQAGVRFPWSFYPPY
ncbi:MULTISPECIES: hypothetical protein [unclassified Halomonas]|uniref:hypothetical protein n=1 Tax=unclassified Halomonas TaxID=2609666 RepID=UPI001CF5A2E5|nr:MULTISPECIES: hypothetical protein [unclassified Halomonas]MCA8864779.1 hypothetical protein [Halomonas sp. SBBP1]UZH11859.1 hypothetical protein OM794_09010 [Halomonas sp. BDJS001]